jgi:hypothetical protein
VGQSSCRKLFLIGDIPIPLKNDGVRQMIKIIPTIGENKKCSKPPTSFQWQGVKDSKALQLFLCFLLSLCVFCVRCFG